MGFSQAFAGRFNRAGKKGRLEMQSGSRDCGDWGSNSRLNLREPLKTPNQMKSTARAVLQRVH
jgi:hypothetical protein